MEQFIRGDQSLGFYGVKSNGEVTYRRMRGFDSLGVSKNPIEYSRKYVDEQFERTDVTGYSPSMEFSFDRILGDAVHDDILDIFNKELTGSDAVREIVIVDLTGTDSCKAMKREFSIIPESESREENLKYSGTFKAFSATICGTAVSTDGWQTCQFTEAAE